MARDLKKVKFHPFGTGYFANPLSHFKDCRINNPIQRGKDNSYFFFKYSHIAKILKEKDFEVSELSKYLKEKEKHIFRNITTCPYLAEGVKKWPMYLNGVEQKITRKGISDLLGEIDFEPIISEAIKSTKIHYFYLSTFNLVEFVARFALEVDKRLFGISASTELDQILWYTSSLRRVQDIFVHRQGYHETNEALLWGKHLFKNSDLRVRLSAKLASEGYTEEDIYSIWTIMFFASFGTTKDSLCAGLRFFLETPEMLEKLLHSVDTEVNDFVEEMLRYVSPIHFTVRVNPTKLELESITIPSKSKLFLCLASANRDEEVFKNPDEFDSKRMNKNHLSFGGGKHHCVGAKYAKIIIRKSLKALAYHLKDFKIHDENTIEWERKIVMRSPAKIMITQK